MISGQELTIIGAGVGGLSAAIALAQRGAKVCILEQAEELNEIGAGLQLSPNAVRVLDALGLDATGHAMKGQGVSLFDGLSGRRVVSFDFSKVAPNDDFLLFHRADLISMLALAARQAGVDIRLGVQLRSVTSHKNAVQVETAQGERLSLPFVIGADGLHSIVRKSLNASQTPFFTGQVAWRATFEPKTAQPPRARVYMGPGSHVVTYPLRDGRLQNLVAIQERTTWSKDGSPKEGWHHTDDPANLRRNFARYCPEAQEPLDQVTDVHLWGLFRHRVADKWHGDRCVILGDAAHSTLPFMAQGAVMAIEDGYVLAQCLARHGLIHGPATYQNLRYTRCSKIVEAANNNARNYHYTNPAARFLGHGALRLASNLAPQKLYDRFRWIYDADVTKF